MYPQQRVRTASAAATLLGDSCKCYGAGSRWRGKVALVTGASAGIGRDIAVQLCATVGMRVVGCSRRGPDLQSAIDDVVARTGGSGGRDGRCEQCGAKLREAPAPEFFGVACDLTRDADIASLFASIDAKWPGAGIDVVINNAGIAHEDTVLEGTTKAWRSMFEVNVIALLTCTREAVKRMTDGREGLVVNVSSMSGHRLTTPPTHVYCATKFAVKAITEATRRELRARASPIRVGAVSPGLVRTEFAAAHLKSEARSKELYKTAPVLVAPDVTGAVLYMLLSPPHVEIHDIQVRPTAQKF